jgi:dimethylargininase
MVSPMGYKVHEINIPENALHLISICSSPADGMLLAPEGYLSPSDFPSDAELLWVPEEEVYAANVIGFGNDILCAAGYPKTHKILEDKGFTLHPIDMSQMRSADGSLTCLSVFY